MKKAALSLFSASVAILVLAASVAAAGPHAAQSGAQAQTRATIPALLGLTQAQVQELRQDGLSLAQIAERQKIDPQKLVDAIVAQWNTRIEARVANGALTSVQAAQLRTQLETRARDMVYRTAPGGMRGAAVGAGPSAGGRGQGAGAGQGWRAGNGSGTGTGTCDGSGPNGAGQG